jgi:hypothetical protein
MAGDVRGLPLMDYSDADNEQWPRSSWQVNAEGFNAPKAAFSTSQYPMQQYTIL